MEPRLGADLSDVRVHTGGDSAKAAQGFGARAFTVGRDVHFNAGQFAPGSKEGDRLLAHELTHVVQERNSGVQRKADDEKGEQAEGGAAPEDEVSQPEDPSEKEADAVGDEVADSLHADAGEKKDGEQKDEKTEAKGSEKKKGEEKPGVKRAIQAKRSNAVHRKILHNGAEISDKNAAIQLLQRTAQEHNRAIDFASHAASIEALIQAPKAYNIYDGGPRNSGASNALSEIILALNTAQNVQPGMYYRASSVEEIIRLGEADLGFVKIDESTYSYRNGGTDALDRFIKGKDFEGSHTDGRTNPRTFENRLVKADDPETGLKTCSLQGTPIRFLEREAEIGPIDTSGIPAPIKEKADLLEQRYNITQSASWKRHRTDGERSGTVGEYLAQANAARLFLPGEAKDGERFEQWANVHFLGDVYESETAPQPKVPNTDAGSELDLMNVKITGGGSNVQCVGVGNVKVGTSNMAGGARTQNTDALTLLRAYNEGTRVQVSGGWAIVKTMTAVDIATQRPVTVPRPLPIDSGVKQVTIGAAGAPGEFDQRLDEPAGEVAQIVQCLRATEQKRKEQKK